MDQFTQQSGAPGSPGSQAPDFNAAAPQQAANPATTPSMQDGGETKGGFFQGVTIVGVAITTFTFLALFYSIYYSRQRIFYLRNEKTQDRKDIEALKADMQSLMSGQYKIS